MNNTDFNSHSSLFHKVLMDELKSIRKNTDQLPGMHRKNSKIQKNVNRIKQDIYEIKTILNIKGNFND